MQGHAYIKLEVLPNLSALVVQAREKHIFFYQTQSLIPEMTHYIFSELNRLHYLQVHTAISLVFKLSQISHIQIRVLSLVPYSNQLLDIPYSN